MSVADVSLEDIDLLSRDVFTERVPHEWFAYLRRHDPVHKHPEPDGPGFWVVTRYDDVVSLNRDWQHYSSDINRGGVTGLEELPFAPGDLPAEMQGTGNIMLMMDPPGHTRYRKLVNKGFTPRMITALEPRIRERASAIIDTALAGNSCDFVTDVAAELPLEAIAELIGVPFDDRHRLFDWSNRMIGSEDPEYAVEPDKMLEAFVEMFVYVDGLAQERRSRPQADILSALLDAELDGDKLSQMDLNGFFLLLSVAGNETTRNAISHGIQAFLDHPEQYQRLREDPSMAASATEEILRFASPVMYFRRNATEDQELHGHQIRAGDKISIWYVSANRDEEVFADPHSFDIGRSPNPHVAFGGGGPHFCLGASLARLEIRVVLEELAERVSSIDAVGPTERLRSNFINGIKHLPVRMQPARPRQSAR